MKGDLLVERGRGRQCKRLPPLRSELQTPRRREACCAYYRVDGAAVGDAGTEKVCIQAALWACGAQRSYRLSVDEKKSIKKEQHAAGARCKGDFVGQKAGKKTLLFLLLVAVRTLRLRSIYQCCLSHKKFRYYPRGSSSHQLG